MIWLTIIATWIILSAPLAILTGRVLGGFRHADETPQGELEG